MSPCGGEGAGSPRVVGGRPGVGWLQHGAGTRRRAGCDGPGRPPRSLRGLASLPGLGPRVLSCVALGTAFLSLSPGPPQAVPPEPVPWPRPA